MFEIKMVNPEKLHAPVGPYCQVATAKASQFVFLAGQTATDHDGNVVGAGDFEAQCRQVFANVETALQSVGAGWRNVVHFTNYLVSPEDQPKFVKFRMGFFPRCFPTATRRTRYFTSGACYARNSWWRFRQSPLFKL